jgi:hypothetical protein
MGARFEENGRFYIFTAFVLSYATAGLGVARTSILNGVLVASALQFFVIPVFGILSGRVGRCPVYLRGAAALAAFAFPFFWIVDTGTRRSIASKRSCLFIEQLVFMVSPFPETGAPKFRTPESLPRSGCVHRDWICREHSTVTKFQIRNRTQGRN